MLEWAGVAIQLMGVVLFIYFLALDVQPPFFRIIGSVTPKFASRGCEILSISQEHPCNPQSGQPNFGGCLSLTNPKSKLLLGIMDIS